jgi:hypothetical protein
MGSVAELEFFELFRAEADLASDCMSMTILRVKYCFIEKRSKYLFHLSGFLIQRA